MVNKLSNYVARKLDTFLNEHKATALTTDIPFSGYGEESDIPLKRIVQRYLTNKKFDYTCSQLMAYSVGSGFTTTIESKTPRAKACLDLIDDFNDTWKLHDKHQVAAYEVAASGNTFYNTPGEGGKLEGLFYIPLSSIIRINRDDDEVINYEQQLGARRETLPADQVAHFKMNPKDGSAFGEGIGQPMERKGLGYQDSNGKWIRKASEFDIDEMIDDVIGKMIYSGMPKHVVTPKDSSKPISPASLEKIRQALNKTDPLKHFLTNENIDIQSMELASQSKHDTFIEKHSQNFTIGMKSPFIPLIGDFSFSYASSQTALDTAFPGIKIFRTNYAKFIEEEIYRPLIIQAGKNPDKNIVHHNWVSIDSLNIDLIQKAVQITSSPEFVDLIDPLDTIKMLNEIGTKFNIKDQGIQKMVKEQIRDNQVFKALTEVSNNEQKANEVLRKSKYKFNL